jgi:GT2 family glycosyltransferase
MLNECLEHIKKHSVGEDYEIIVEENVYKGFPEPVNRGILKAGLNDVIVMSDDLIINEDGWISALKNMAYTNEKICAVTASTSLHNIDHLKTKYGEINYVIAGWNPIYIKRDILNRIGGLDEGFYIFFNENDWCLRAHLAGYTIGWQALKVDHMLSRTISKYVKDNGMFKISQDRFKVKWGIP